LKLIYAQIIIAGNLVAPRTGAWIETSRGSRIACSGKCRPPHGGVD